ncbi:O17/O44/O106 family O-antigen flippase, partial [Salmonella enterica subsp. enterica serovar Uzaramo]|nr:O17/O44/O106 family O-antigen flippase [Salmonella enterica subsp. enterica serovar Uzaramo]
MIKEIFSDGIFSLFNKICYFGFKTLAIILVTRSLGEQVGGDFIFLVGLLEVLRVVTDFGVDIFSIKKYNELSDNKLSLLNLVLNQKIISGLIVGVIFLFYCFFNGYDYRTYLPVVLALPVALFFNLSNSYFQALNDNKKLTLPIVIASIVTCFVFIIQYLSLAKFDAWDYLFVEFIFVFFVSAKLFRFVSFKFFKNSFFNLLKSIFILYKATLSIGLTAVVVIIYSRVDNFYIKSFAPDDLAAYGQIFRMIDPLVMVSSVFSTVAYARFCRINLQEKYAFSKVFQFLLCIVAYGVFSSFVYFFIMK